MRKQTTRVPMKGQEVDGDCTYCAHPKLWVVGQQGLGPKATDLHLCPNCNQLQPQD